MLKEDIEEFIFARIKNVPKDKKFWNEYGKAIDNSIEKAHKIIELLTEENKNLFFDYEEYSNEVASYEIEEAYKKGFSDCFQLLLKLYEIIKRSD